MTSVQVAPYSLCEKLDCRFTFDWLTSYPDCNFALNCAGSPRRFSRQDLQDRKWHSLQSGKRTQLQYPFRIDDVLLEIRNQKERCCSSIGQRIILPTSFTRSPRYLYQKYQDCIGICRKFGCPDLFVTFTSIAAWPKILGVLPPGLTPSDRPEIVDRVFKMKLNILMDDIKKRNFFGPINAVVYTIDFQKCGLPHDHIIIWL
jgi:hypothetical protein